MTRLTCTRTTALLLASLAGAATSGCSAASPNQPAATGKAPAAAHAAIVATRLHTPDTIDDLQHIAAKAPLQKVSVALAGLFPAHQPQQISAAYSTSGSTSPSRQLAALTLTEPSPNDLQARADTAMQAAVRGSGGTEKLAHTKSYTAGSSLIIRCAELNRPMMDGTNFTMATCSWADPTTVGVVIDFSYFGSPGPQAMAQAAAWTKSAYEQSTGNPPN